MGLPTLAAAGSLPRSSSAIAALREATFMPACSTASAAMMPGPPALVMMATRSPLGSGCMARAVARSNRPSKVSARMTPARLKAAP